MTAVSSNSTAKCVVTLHIGFLDESDFNLLHAACPCKALYIGKKCNGDSITSGFPHCFSVIIVEHVMGTSRPLLFLVGSQQRLA